MAKEISEVFARRARLSSKAIVTAIMLTLAALVAVAIAARQERQASSLKDLDPVTRLSIGTGSGLVPVVNR
ncbi:hypothetical protein [Hyphomicrobium sp.]|uniref:hypothetical protein n=1 Tax=Hyphomicrobium sp. TaxID=82 RepID=UPI000FAD54A8|nr:hypothetical protein [Hyphomicrobium sp.]RUO97334.1 MAG: hypothetical protein EKK30_17745 [Hyphomicrobium sp.]